MASWDFSSPELPGISIEESFAERMDLKIGDTLSFDVQSVPVTGRVMNTRKVDWNSFQPNFFVSFQPGVLDPAPKTFVAAISEVADADRLPVQNSIVVALPNISINHTSRKSSNAFSTSPTRSAGQSGSWHTCRYSPGSWCCSR